MHMAIQIHAYDDEFLYTGLAGAVRARRGVGGGGADIREAPCGKRVVNSKTTTESSCRGFYSWLFTYFVRNKKFGTVDDLSLLFGGEPLDRT